MWCHASTLQVAGYEQAWLRLLTDIILPPSAAPIVQSTSFSSYHDVKNSKAILEQLSAGAANAEAASRRCQQSIQDVQRLLDTDSLTTLTFKRPLQSNVTAGSTESSNSKPTTLLSPFAKMVLDNRKARFRYLTPDQSPEPPTDVKGYNSNKSISHALATSPSYITPSHGLPNGLAPSQSNGLSPSSQQRQVSAVMPKTLSDAPKAEYQYIPDQDAALGAQYLTPSGPPTSSITNRATNLAQREQSTQRLHTLQNVLTDILQQADQLRSDGSGSEIFELLYTDEGSKLALPAKEQSKLENLLSKVEKDGRLTEVDSDDLQRAQQLFEVPAGAVVLLSLAIGDGWTDQDVDEWLQRIDLASHGLSAARTLLLVMIGCSNIQELQTEDHLSTVVNGLANVIDRLIIPVIEERPALGEKARADKATSPSNTKFALAAAYRQNIQAPLATARRTMRSLGQLLTRVDVEESIISRVLSLCKSIIFAENANTERDAAIGVTAFEEMRRETMDVYARIFAKHVNQRSYILSEILSSLEKLPATKQSARQYRLQNAKPIQLVSALLMRLVQTSATPGQLASQARLDDEDDNSVRESEDELDSDKEAVHVARRKSTAKSGSLVTIVKPFHDAALANAQYIVGTLIEKAIGTSKTGDEPYRRLLDIFTEDFINVLGSSDWPASEMLLRTLVRQTIGLVENPKNWSAPARTLALELLGVIGSGIVELQIQARHAEEGIDMSEEMADKLKVMMQETESGPGVDRNDLVALDGPYRLWAEYLDARGADDKASLRSARGYLLTDWTYTAVTARDASVDSDSVDISGLSGELQTKLREMVLDPGWLDEYSTLRIGTSVGRLAVLVTMLNSKLCRAFPKILNVLLTSMNSEQPTLRSRSLKSVNTLLEKDATMLDRFPTILGYIFRCLQDRSALVRDSALTLLQRCTALRPKMDGKAYAKVIDRTRDNNIGVRKRAMKMLKEVYLRNPDVQAMRSAMVNAILWRLEDMEDSVVELARQIMEEIWFIPFHGITAGGGSSVETKLAIHSHAALVIATVECDDRLLSLLEGLTHVFSVKSKLATANVEVCRTIICVLFDGVIDSGDIPGAPAQSAILRSLTVFAKATPKLFTAPQLECLEVYTQNLTKTDELEIYRYVLTILRHVMPHVTRTLKKEFVQRLQTSLLTSCTKLQKPELREVAPCLWTINGILDNIDRLVNFMISVLININSMHMEDLSNRAIATKVSRLMVIASEFGNACDFAAHFKSFKAKCNWLKADSVPGLIVETLCVFSSANQPQIVRRTAIDGICTVAQAWPKQFLRADVIKVLELAFKERIPEIESVALAGFEGFFVAQEAPDASDAPELPAGIASGTERLGRTYVATDNDGALTSLAQRHLQDVLRIALSSCTEPAFIAARLVVSVNKQGLVHPNESCPALVALETCPNKYVAGAAFKEHKSQHQKHETLFEKEYVRAVQQTFDYQSNVIGSPVGVAEGQTPNAKMHLLYEVIKGGKAQGRKKFLVQLSRKMDFDTAKLDTREAVPRHLAFVRFCCENLALFEYDKVEDVLQLMNSLENVFGGTGSTVANAIESELLQIHVGNKQAVTEFADGTPDTMQAEPSGPSEIDPARVRQLCIFAQIVSMIWETRSFLRKVWTMQKHMDKKKGKEKDAQKAPSRATNAPSLIDAYLKRIREIMGSAASEQDQRAMCAAFAELMAVDKDVKVNSDDEENIDMDVLPGYDTPSESSDRKSPSVGASGGGRGRKRKASVSVGGTPRKKGGPKKSASFNLAEDEDDDGGWD